MKKNIDIRTKLFENMVKLNPGFKMLNVNNLKKLVTEAEDKRIQKVVNPENKSINEQFGGFDYKVIIDKLKKKIDDLLDQGDFDSLDALYRLLVPKSERESSASEKMMKIAEQQMPDNRRKSELLKGKIDFLAATNHYDIIEKLNNILDKIFPSVNEPDYS
jgi:hypothetical protein